MSAERASNPFVPGHGGLPPYVAGRAMEQAEMRKLGAYLEAGRGAPRNLIVSGPRGNGKTVLLRWFQREIETAGGIDVLWRTPSDLSDLDALATSLVPPGRFKAMLPDTLSVSIAIGRLGWELGNNTGTLTDLLTVRCNHRPLVVLLDEAHTLDADVGRALLNASQSVSAVSPFLLALAGTPGLEPHLNTMSATFWNRAKHLGVGLLDGAAAAEALTRPLAAQQPPITFEPAALERVVGESQCYPYFVQVWGAVLWETNGGSDAATIDDSLVAAAAPAFAIERDTYYEHRFDELERRDLLEVAQAVADAFAGRSDVPQNELNAVIGRTLADPSTAEILSLRDQLALVGYVWKPPGTGPRWEAGIPSLMRYVCR